ncbi:ribosomal biogenesis protein LAS1L [Caerostris extrusa]|uniref:Ribosomal biogenesis protein LAS1L n=1 Tax=Caerostris extrusa TaxID=172846 RepID=A0AAV4P276_CAEEX|nr:ribosomal biogenesis protein LAS1L [Caerostris extrusa]
MESNLPEPKSHATVVPWRTQDEFINVYEKLYSTKLEDKRWAIDTIHIWESRCHAGLPTAIEATYCLVRAVIQDTLFNENLTFMIEKDLVSMYAVGLIRFVNLRTEHLQNASFKLRVSDLAEKNGHSTMDC